MNEDKKTEKEPRPETDASKEDPPKVKTGASLTVLGAAIRSFFEQPLDFYPRLETKVRSVSSDEIIKRFSGVMGPWSALKANDTNLDKAIDLAKASLQEAKAQTEYQDQKATRLLTVSTFLTALAGAFYMTFSTDYPLKTLSQQTRRCLQSD